MASNHKTPGEVVIPKVWRSELNLLIIFFIASILSVILSRKFPGSVITGELFSLAGVRVTCALPLFWLVPCFTLLSAIIRVYDVKYTLDSSGIETRVGILSTNQRITRIRFEDIRSAETDQTIMERMLDIGDLFIGTAAQSDVEIIMEGIAHPEEVQDMIHRERDRRQKVSQGGFKSEGSVGL